MKKELSDALYLNYPDLFKYKVELDVGDGWHELVRELSSKLSALHPNIRAAQVKEKFGGLRFYIETEGDVPSEIMDKAYVLENEYENMSMTICEDCGRPGIRQDGGWIRTLCKGCSSK